MERFFEKLTFHIWSFFTVNIGTKLVSIAIAVVLWVVVLGSRNVEVTKEIPLEVITPGELVPSNDIPDRIAFRLSGPKAFLRAILDRREEPIRVNLSGAKPGLVTYRFFSDNIRVPIGVKVLSINPTAILIKLETVKRREVPVHAQLQGSPAEGFHVVDQELKPSTVKIKGAESRVEAVTEVSTVPIDLTGANKPIETPVSLDLSRYNVQLDSPAPRLSVDIQPVAANYRIKGVDVRVLSSFKVKMDEKTVTVLVRAGATQLTELDREHVYAVVDLRGKPKGHYTPSVKVTLPEEVGLVKVIPEHVDVTLY